jgi:acyl-CoA synthetase (AMP-forming)/AMP-acid ligase II
MSNTSGAAIVTDLLRKHASQRPEAAALWFEGRETSFAMLDRRSSQCARAMLAGGVRPGDRIATLTLNSDLFPVLWFGAMKTRACLVPINTRLAPPEIAAIIRDSGARRLVFAQGLRGIGGNDSARVPGLGDARAVRAKPRARARIRNLARCP